MAERRMFAKTIIDSDVFLDMPLSTQSLYFHLSMRADDDGFINNPKKIQRMIGASDDDLKLLIAKNFIIQFESGVIVIKHWRIHNYIRNDRYKPTVYEDEKKCLTEKENKAYTLALKETDTVGIPNGYQMDTQVRLGKDRLGKDRIGKDNNISPESKKASEQKVVVYADVPAIPLNDGSEWSMPQELYDEYLNVYPALNLKQELSKMRVWCLANPANRKTKRGVTRFINGWLERAQNNNPNRGVHGRTNTQHGTAEDLDNFYAMADAWANGGDTQ